MLAGARRDRTMRKLSPKRLTFVANRHSSQAVLLFFATSSARRGDAIARSMKR